jgi:hypothetical protein
MGQPRLATWWVDDSFRPEQGSKSVRLGEFVRFAPDCVEPDPHGSRRDVPISEVRGLCAEEFDALVRPSQPSVEKNQFLMRECG